MPDSGTTPLAVRLRRALDEAEALLQQQPPWPWRLNAEGDEVIAADDETVAEAFALSSNQQRNIAAYLVRWGPSTASRLIERDRALLAEYEAAGRKSLAWVQFEVLHGEVERAAAFWLGEREP